MSARHRLFLWAAPLVALSWLVIAVLEPDGRHGPFFEYVYVGLVIGTLFGQATAAAAWNAFGPGPLAWRLPLSLVWVVMFAVAFSFNVNEANAIVVLGGCLLAQWFLVQLPLWGLVVGYELRLRHRDEVGLQLDPRESQFGIRQLMILTAIVGVAFGIGRHLVTSFGDRVEAAREAPIFAFLAIAAIMITLPLLLAALLPRWSLVATVVVLVLIGLATVWELPMFRRVDGARGPGPEVLHFVAINAFTSAWILAIAAITRLNGYCLAASGSRMPRPATRSS